MSTIAELEEKLRWKDMSIKLMLEIDRIRDSFHDEQELVTAVLGCLMDALGADLGLLYQREEEGGRLRLRALVDRAHLYTGRVVPQLKELAEQAATRSAGDCVQSNDKLGDAAQAGALAFPLRVGKEDHGAIVVVDSERPFSSNRIDLACHGASQIDTALDHARTIRELRVEKAETELIYRIDRIRDEHEDLQAMLDAVLPEVCRATCAQTAFVMLYDSSGKELELRAATDFDLLELGDPSNPIHNLTREAIESAKMVERNFPAGPIRSIMGQPLILRDKLIGVLGIINRLGRDTFTTSDRHLLAGVASQVDTAIFEGLQVQRIRNAFGQCVGPGVMRRLLAASDTDLLSGDRLSITTLFSDIRGFTGMAGHLKPELLQVVINDHLSAMTNLVLEHEATLDKYIGDSVMCFFNAPERQEDHALRAVRLAMEMHRAHDDVVERWRGRLHIPPIGIGIATGETIVGNFGSVKRLEYTVIGNYVNLAARLCGAAAGRQTLISDQTRDMVKEQVEAELMPPQKLKGIEDQVSCWSVVALK